MASPNQGWDLRCPKAPGYKAQGQAGACLFVLGVCTVGTRATTNACNSCLTPTCMGESILARPGFSHQAAKWLKFGGRGARGGGGGGGGGSCCRELT